MSWGLSVESFGGGGKGRLLVYCNGARAEGIEDGSHGALCLCGVTESVERRQHHLF